MQQRVSLSKAAQFIKTCLQARVTPYISGSPGMGKSAIVQAVCDSLCLKMIDIRLAQEDPTTINGFPELRNGRSVYLPPRLFPLAGDSKPVRPGFEAQYTEAIKAANGNAELIRKAIEAYCYRGWVVFFDELPSAAPAVQAAAYKIILDRKIGEHSLHEHCYIVAAGNLLTDNAIANEMGTALRSRMSHIIVESDSENYLKYIAKKQYDLRIQAYLAANKGSINNFKKYQDHSSDETFACERTWEMVDRILKVASPNQNEAISTELEPLLQGTVGSIALEFVTYTHAFKDLPTLQEILDNPQNAMLPSKPGTRYLLVAMLVNNATLDNVDTMMDYVSRLPKEFAFTAVKMLWGRDVSFLDNPKVEAIFDEISVAMNENF